MTNLPVPIEPFLWDCFWQSSVCLLLGLLGGLCWARRPARAHRVLLLALGAALLAPLLSLAVRHYGWGMLPPRVSAVGHNSVGPTPTAPALPSPQSAAAESAQAAETSVATEALTEARAREKRR
ncbi:MAG: hypothetical protein FJ398_09630 [Verrucomicrobia bacterium]|nr:hypothetical protein [Verrucomicrobiota bacterium]